MTITDFLNNELVDYAKYSTIRAIPSYIDGLKNSSRKIIYTALSELSKPTKVSVFSGVTQLKTLYLHGDISDTVVNLSREFTGTNNLPLLQGSGNFGTRMLPEASASRYIFTEKAPYFNYIINPLDQEILIKQEFEGEEIEPRFFVPDIPMALVNQSLGIATGFATSIYPRDPKALIKYLLASLKNEKTDERDLDIFFKGYKGKIIKEKDKTVIKGIYNINRQEITITEIPIGQNLNSYKTLLDNLEDKKTIKSYEDLSQNDEFKFIIKVEKAFIEKGQEYLEKTLGLVKPLNENLTFLDQNNNIITFNNVKELIEKYINIKLEYLQKRKDYILAKKTKSLKEMISECFFIKKVLEQEIDLKEQNKEDIIILLEQESKFVKKNDSFDYLFKIPLISLTPKKLSELKQKIKDLKQDIDNLANSSIQELWIKDLEKLQGII